MIGKENGDRKTKKNMTYSSLPSPEDLVAYREILEDAPERIFETVERDKIITRRIAGVFFHYCLRIHFGFKTDC